MAGVLIVDDEKSIRKTMKAFLDKEGYDVSIAEDAEKAINLLKSKSFDIVVTDIILPGLSGVDLLKAIKEVAPNVLVIMMTGQPTIETASESLRWGAFDYISKPISKSAILRIVANALNIKHLNDEKRRLEEENRRHREELEQLVAEKTESLRKSQDQLRQAQKMEAIGTLAGGIAHDFNNLLSVIIGQAQLIGYDLPEDSPTKEDLDDLLAAAFRATELVNQILTFCRKTEQEKQSLLLSPIIKESIKFLRSTLPPMIEIREKIRPGQYRVFADPTQMQQIVMNICTNAAHAMKKKGGVLEIGIDMKNIDSKNRKKWNDLKSGHYVYLTIKDTGTGMEKETLERIFDPYFTTKPKGEGTGLGLSVVHGIVKNHGGSIQVKSTLGKGSEFRVLLPIEKKKRPTVKPLDSEEILQGTGNILIIDDEPGVIKSVGKLLKRIGYTVTTEVDARKALKMIESDPGAFDLVITDFIMPHIQGDVLVEKIKKIRRDMPVILSSGYSDTTDGDEITEKPGDAFLKKPYDWKKLSIIIRGFLDGAKSNPEE